MRERFSVVVINRRSEWQDRATNGYSMAMTFIPVNSLVSSVQHHARRIKRTAQRSSIDPIDEFRLDIPPVSQPAQVTATH